MAPSFHPSQSQGGILSEVLGDFGISIQEFKEICENCVDDHRLVLENANLTGTISTKIGLLSGMQTISLGKFSRFAHFNISKQVTT